jgi:Na+/H+ antiporter NhaD/arsenite permease-like protein
MKENGRKIKAPCPSFVPSPLDLDPLRWDLILDHLSSPSLSPLLGEKSKQGAVALLWSLPSFYFRSNFSPLLRSSIEYFSFICLIGSLFIVSGGISITGNLKAKPATNVAFLGIGAILANLFGTTGASMLLIRPFLKTNSERRNTWHLPLFFIFLVSNIGGLLTPLGDPPLFLGYLNGVPFHWTLRLFPQWLFMVALLLFIFFLWDRRAYRKETPSALKEDRFTLEPIRIQGKMNLLLLMGVVGLVYAPTPFREMGMIVLSAVSYFFTPGEIHQRNRFGLFPLVEVAILFAGIFITMTLLLRCLKVKGPSLPLTNPGIFGPRAFSLPS